MAGLVLALAAAQGPPSGPAGGRPAVRLLASVPAPLEVTVFGLFALTALAVLWLLIPRGLRRRKKDDERFEMVYETPKVSPWLAAGMLALGAAPLGFLGYLLWRAWSPLEVGRPPAPWAAGASALVPPSQGALVPDASVPWFSGAVTVLGLVAGVGCLGLVLWILFGDRMIGSWEGLLAGTRTPEPLLEAIDDSLETIRREPDARRAIVRCYRRFERALTRRGLPRDPWETPTEFMRRALGRLPLPAGSVRSLIDLFHVARFSDHPLGTRERDLAVDSLVGIRAALEGETANAPPA